MKKFNLLITFLCFCIYTMAQTQGIGIFSVSETEKVTFSPGNLQFNAALGSHKCADGSTQPGTWRFAEHQWDYVGDATNGTVYMVNGNDSVKCNNALISETYDGWIDLFGWGTSGWNSGAVAYQPWATSSASSDYYPGGNYLNDLTGDYANADWGVYNQIGDDAPGSWRTLTKDEWNYILNRRRNAINLCGQATINNIKGVVLLPDNWDTQSAVTFIKGDSLSFTSNTYTLEQWTKMNQHGAVFLPASGSRYGQNVEYSESFDYSNFWSSSAYKDSAIWAYTLYFYDSYLSVLFYDRNSGFSVRLIKDIDGRYLPNPIFDSVSNAYIQPDTLWYDIILLKDTLINNDNNYIINDNSYIEIIAAKEGTYEGYIYIPDTIQGLPVKAIGNRAFYAQYGITHFELPNTLTTLEERCFSACENIKEIIFPDNIERLPSECFEACTRLQKVTLPKKIKFLNYQCFNACWLLEDIKLPEGITSIGYNAFNGVYNLKKIEFPQSVTSFDSNIIGGTNQNHGGAWLFITEDNRLIYPTDNNPNTRYTGYKSSVLLDTVIIKSFNHKINSNTFADINNSKTILFVPDLILSKCLKDTMYSNHFKSIKGISTLYNLDFENNDSTYNLIWPAIPNTSEYHILILDSAKVDTIGEFWIDSLGENITPAAPNTEVTIMRKPKDGSQDLFKLKLKVGNGSNGGTPTPAQAAEMPNGQKKLLTSGKTYSCTLTGTDAEGETTIDINSDFTVQSQETPDGLINVPHTTHPTTHKEMRDGQILIITPNAKYDLNGRKTE